MDPARDLVVDGGPCAIGVESTIVDCTATPPRVLRVGAISQEQVDAALAGGDVGAADRWPGDREPSVDELLEAVEVAPGSPGVGDVRAPGTLESHYAPSAQVLLVEPDHVSTAEPCGRRRERPSTDGLVAPSSVSTPEGWTRLGSPDTPDEYARSLYAALRRADASGLAVVVAVLPDPREGPLAVAVRDRLSRAAHES